MSPPLPAQAVPDLDAEDRAAGWTRPVKASGQSRVSGGYPVVVAAPEGDVTVLWSSPRGIVKSRTRQAGGSWGSVLRVGEGDLQDAAADHSGAVTAVWRHWIGGRTVAVGATRPDGGAWSKPRRLSRVPRSRGTHTQAFDVQLAVSPEGAAVAAWTFGSQDAGPVDRAQASYRPAGGRWGPPVRLADPWSWSSDVAISAAGVPMVLVQGDRFLTMRRTDRGWRRVGGPVPGRTWDPGSLAIGPAGDEVLAFDSVRRRGEGRAREHRILATRLIKGQWRRPARISGNVRASQPDVEVDTDGVGTVAWRTAKGRIQVSRWVPGRKPGRPVTLSGRGAGAPSVAVATNGAAVVAWSRSVARGPDQILASTRPAGGTWRRPWVISDNQDVIWPQGAGLDVWPQGRGVVAWTDDSRRPGVWVSWKR
jgi:hypothetical protein